ncbi:hypothetical protein [Phenylobacterium sp. J367]|uniref:hypothetical protein n=1 Tax=Phenylobacterium sp. J367 TaxID=2898435 RepID=UPI002150D96A|nr:hypothetical protein [Phenylobacterium sp. J367]MCR5879015.1 hypothetical protein [Phenylobacterium sp. J367]
MIPGGVYRLRNGTRLSRGPAWLGYPKSQPDTGVFIMGDLGHDWLAQDLGGPREAAGGRQVALVALGLGGDAPMLLCAVDGRPRLAHRHSVTPDEATWILTPAGFDETEGAMSYWLESRAARGAFLSAAILGDTRVEPTAALELRRDWDPFYDPQVSWTATLVRQRADAGV